MFKIKRWDLIEFQGIRDPRLRRGIVVGLSPSSESLDVVVRGESSTIYVFQEDVKKTISDSLLGKYITNIMDGDFPEKVFLKKRKRFWEVWK